MGEKQRKKARKEAERKARAEAGKPTDEEMEKLLAGLSNEEAEMFVSALELAIRKRRVMLLGYLAALASLLLGIAFAFWIYGNRDPGQFVGWAFLIPPAAAGAVLMIFGRLSRRLLPTPPRQALRPSPDGGEEE